MVLRGSPRSTCKVPGTSEISSHESRGLRNARAARHLEAIWEKLEPTSAPLPTAPPLGYRGCFVRDPRGRQWYAYGGRVLLTTGGASETRADPNRQFEKTLLESAPADILPANFLTFLREE